MNVMVDVTPSNKGDTLPLCLAPLMGSIGRPEWSVSRLEGIMNHAFHFEINEGGAHVMHDNIDWGPALDFLPELTQFRTFDANEHTSDVDLPALKREARDAVRAGLEKGYAALGLAAHERRNGSESPPRILLGIDRWIQRSGRNLHGPPPVRIRHLTPFATTPSVTREPSGCIHKSVAAHRTTPTRLNTGFASSDLLCETVRLKERTLEYVESKPWEVSYDV